MYPNLEAELKRRNIKRIDLAKHLGIGISAISDKMQHKSDFSLSVSVSTSHWNISLTKSTKTLCRLNERSVFYALFSSSSAEINFSSRKFLLKFSSRIFFLTKTLLDKLERRETRIYHDRFNH